MTPRTLAQEDGPWRQFGAAVGPECTLFMSAFFSGVDVNDVVSGSWTHRATIECSSKILRMQISDEVLRSPGGQGFFGSPATAQCFLCTATTSGGGAGCDPCNGV